MQTTERKNQVFRINHTVSFMNYQPGQDYDCFYPTIDDLNNLGTVMPNGDIEYSEDDIAFLMWIQRPVDPENITPQQKQITLYAMQLINDYIEGVVPDDDPDEQKAKIEIMQKYARKHK